MPQAFAPGAAARRRIDGHDDAHQIRRRARPAGLDQVAAEQRVGIVVDDLGIEFLPSEPRAAVARLDLAQELRRQEAAVVERRRARQQRVGVRHQTLQQRHRARRRGHHDPWSLAQAKAELQHVPGFLRMAPLGQFVTPGDIELGPAQAVGLLGGKDLRDRPVGPHDPPQRGLEQRAFTMAVHAQQSRYALDHDRTDFGDRRPDERDTARRRIGQRLKSLRLAPYPFGTAARLAGAAPTENQPHPEVGNLAAVARRQLVEPGPGRPVSGEQFGIVIRNLAQEAAHRAPVRASR
jgi:hypothetical protein